MEWTWSEKTAELIDMEDELVCGQTDNYNVDVPFQISHQRAMKVCKNLGNGVMPVATNRDELKKYIQLFKLQTSNINKCGNIWTPITDQEEEGMWRWNEELEEKEHKLDLERR